MQRICAARLASFFDLVIDHCVGAMASHFGSVCLQPFGALNLLNELVKDGIDVLVVMQGGRRRPSASWARHSLEVWKLWSKQTIAVVVTKEGGNQ